MNVIAYEFFEYIWNGGVVDDFIDEGDDVDGIEGLREVYCY